MRVLAIETSCDETAIAFYEDSERGLLEHQVYSQVAIHQHYGGVVPELASRDHLRKTLPLIEDTLKKAGMVAADIKGVVYTKGPGLIGALMVGASIAHGLAYGWRVPVLGVHHIEAHLMAVMLEQEYPHYPFIALIISGGHTMLLRVNGFGDYQLLGETLDDAVGEAFDKTATLLGLPYPGGPALATLAEHGNSKRFHFPRPMINRPGFDFSFSGLKTFALNCINAQKQKLNAQVLADIACAFEDAVVDTLLIKSRLALKQLGLDQLVVAGGVSANQKLRRRLSRELEATVFFPRTVFCTDNAAMVAYTGCRRILAGERDTLSIEVRARWPIQEVS